MVEFYTFFCYVMLAFFVPKIDYSTMRTEHSFCFGRSFYFAERLFYCVMSLTNYRTFVLISGRCHTTQTMRTEQMFYRTPVRQNRSAGFQLV